MKNRNPNYSRLCLLGAALVLAVGILNTPLHAQTIWDGGAFPDTSINNVTNWNNDIAILTGSQNVSFAASGSPSNVATMNVPAKFKTITFNRAIGFTVNGSSTLAVSNSTGSGSPNITISSGQNAGPTVIDAPFAVETGTTATKLLNILNNSTNNAGGPSLIFSNTVSPTVAANPFAFRLQGSGTGRFVGPITNCASIQPALAAYTGTNIIAGNQTLATNGVIACDVGIFAPGTSSSSSTARIQMGESINDIQTWRSTSVSQIGTVAINSTATLLGGVGIENNNTAGTHGGILEVNGSLTATTLGIGSGSFVGTLKLAGPAYFSGTMSVGATPGSLILGNAATVSPLTLSSGTISSSVTIGGGGANQNNISLIKTNSGTLTLGGTHTYTGATVVQAGRLDLTGIIASSITVADGAILGGEGSTTGGVTFGSGTEFFNYDPISVAVFTANTIDASGATVIVNPSSSVAGVVMQSTTTPNGITGTPGVNFISGARGNLTLNGAADTLSFTPTSAANLVWKGGAANPTFWDVITTTNWNNGSERFYSSDAVLFDDTASSFVVAVQNNTVIPGSTTFSNNANAYTLTNGSIGGTGSLTKDGTNDLNIAFGGHSFSGGLTINAGKVKLSGGANTFTGGITNNGGTLVISNLNQIYAVGGGSSSNSINLNGGAFSYTGGTITSETLTFNLLGNTSTIDVNDVLTGTNNFTLRTGAPVTGSGDLIKTGIGTLTFGKNSAVTLGNTFTGKVTVNGGTMDVRNPDSLGATTTGTEVNNAQLQIFPFGQILSFSIDPEPITFNGNSEFRYQPPTPGINTYVTWSGLVTNTGNLNITSFPNTNDARLVFGADLVNLGATTLNFGYNTNGASTNVNRINVNGIISGAATVTTSGTNGSLYTFSAANVYTGNTTINGGILSLGGSGSIANSPVITVGAGAEFDVTGASFTLGGAQTLKGNGSISGDVTANGTIIPGASVGVLTFSNNLTINGNVVVELDKSLPQSNDVINVLGTLNNTGTGTLTVSNLGPALVAGEKFTLFSQPVSGGSTLNISAPAGVTFTNQLDVDGSITVLTAPATTASYSTNITASVSGSTLTLNWPSTHLGWFLQAQTNTLGVGLTMPTNTWFDVSGSDAASSSVITINPANPSVFFRLRHP